MEDRYVSPLSERYASKEMQYIFSPEKKFRTWRKLWIALAETERELGLPITEEQIEELKSHQDDINFEVAKERERLCLLYTSGCGKRRDRIGQFQESDHDTVPERKFKQRAGGRLKDAGARHEGVPL